jgi:hypothetical protein
MSIIKPNCIFKTQKTLTTTILVPFGMGFNINKKIKKPSLTSNE